jgi:hypothetical protein
LVDQQEEGLSRMQLESSPRPAANHAGYVGLLLLWYTSLL